MEKECQEFTQAEYMYLVVGLCADSDLIKDTSRLIMT